MPRRDQVLPKSMLKHFQQNINFVTKLIVSATVLAMSTSTRSFVSGWNYPPIEDWKLLLRSNNRYLRSFAFGAAVKIVRSTATEYLDELAGITRSTRDKLEKRVFSLLRSLGKKCANEKIGSFKRKNQERISKAFVEKLRQLPLVNGQPDFSAIGDRRNSGKNGQPRSARPTNICLNNLSNISGKTHPNKPSDQCRRGQSGSFSKCSNSRS